LDTKAEPGHWLLPDVDQNGLHIGFFLGLPLLSIVATGQGPELYYCGDDHHPPFYRGQLLH